MRLLSWVNKQLRFPRTRVETVRKQRTWSLVQGALWGILVVISIFDGGWRWVTTIYAVGCVVLLIQGILADVELNRREHRNYPPTDPDGLRLPVDVAEH